MVWFFWKHLRCCLSRPLDDLNSQLDFALAVCIFVLSLFTFFAIHIQDKYFSLFDLILKSLVWIISNIQYCQEPEPKNSWEVCETRIPLWTWCRLWLRWGINIFKLLCLRYYKCHFFSRLTYSWPLFWYLKLVWAIFPWKWIICILL